MAAEAPAKRKLTPAHVPELKEFFLTVPERQRMTSLEAVREMQDDIRELQKKGYTLNDIGKMIEGQGFDLPISTFRNYLKQVGYRKTPGTQAPAAKTRKPKALSRLGLTVEREDRAPCHRHWYR